MADGLDSCLSIENDNSEGEREITLYKDNRPLLKTECGVTLGLLKLIYSTDGSYSGVLLGVKPRLSTGSIPCVVTFDRTQLTHPSYDLIVQATPGAVHIQRATSREEQTSADPQRSHIATEGDITSRNRNHTEDSSHTQVYSANAQRQHEETSDEPGNRGSSSVDISKDSSQDHFQSLLVSRSTSQPERLGLEQVSHEHQLPSHPQVNSSSEDLLYMNCDRNELPDSTVQEFDMGSFGLSSEADMPREIDEPDYKPEEIQFNPEEFNFDIGSVIPFKSDKGTRWPCDRCGKDFCSSSHLKRHWILHTDFKPYKCKVCDKCFPFHWDLKKHMTRHTGNKPFKCAVCPKSFNSQEERRNHNWLHTGKKEYKCQVCHREFSSHGNLKIHMRKHTGEKPYKCDYCPKSFYMLGHYQYHVRRHTGEKPYKCDICGKAFSYSNNLNEHKNIHTGERPYSCSLCEKKFTHRSTYKQHVLMHQGNKPYKCHVCSKSFVQSSNYQRHITTHKKKEERVQKCDLCGKELLSRRGVQRHRLRCVKRTVERANSSEVTAPKDSRLKRGEYRCEHCPKVFAYNRRLEAHVKKKHSTPTEDSTVKPSSVTSIEQENASSHELTSQKSKRGEFRCEHCPKIFVYSRRLAAHVKQKHSSSTEDNRPKARLHPRRPPGVQCSACGRWFGYTKRLREHQMKAHQRGVPQGSATTTVPQISNSREGMSIDSYNKNPHEVRDLTEGAADTVPRAIHPGSSPARSQSSSPPGTANRYLHLDERNKQEAEETGFEALSALSRLSAKIAADGSVSFQSLSDQGPRIVSVLSGFTNTPKSS